MKCPSCQSALSTHVIDNVSLDFCSSGCGGIWFDQFEFKKFDEHHEPHPEEMLQFNPPTKPVVKAKDLLPCPRCPDSRIRLQRHFSSPKRQVTIDTCPKCAGVWLDLGELSKIRSEYKDENERKKAAEKMVDEIFNQTTKAETHRRQGKLSEAQSFANALRFLCPSYYIPGKQRGGAF